MKKLLALALLALPLLAQSKITPTVTQVADRRTKGSFSRLEITLELPGIKGADVAASRVLVSAATDDSGTSLLPEEASAELEPNARALYGKDDGPASVQVALKNPSRKSTAVRQVTGEIELFMPSKDPNSVAEIAKFTSQAGKTLSHKALKANGVEIASVSEAQLAAERKRLTDAKKKELTDAGYDEETTKSVLESFADGLLKFDDGDVPLRVKDPNKRIQDIVYVDGKGETKHVSAHEDDKGFTVLSTWGEKPQPDWKLRVSMKTQKNLVRYPFVLSNVALP